MFGYFRFKGKYTSANVRKAYKNYYCGLCFALEKHYGNLSRMLLSYDVATLAVVIKAHNEPLCSPISCVGKCNCKAALFDNENWKKLAAINILLAAEKMRDDILDEGSVKAKAGSIIFKHSIVKAQKGYPQIVQIIRKGYDKILTLEKANSDVMSIGVAFADMMVSLVKNCFVVEEKMLKFIHAIAVWLYYIDALDDYDKDIVKGRFNPLLLEKVDFSQYKNQFYTTINKDLKYIFKEFSDIKDMLGNSYEDKILYGLLDNAIPSVTCSVLKQQELPKLLHLKKDTVWTGA